MGGFNGGSVLGLREQEATQRGESETILRPRAQQRVQTVPGVTENLEDWTHGRDPVRSVSQEGRSGDAVERGTSTLRRGRARRVETDLK